MTEQELNFVENQLKKIGLGEAFTPDLVKVLKSGETTIQYPFQKNYDGDEAKAVLHLRKSGTTNMYFFNKYDLTVRKDGQNREASHTFYINSFKRNGNEDQQNQGKYSTTFTFKSAYNYLCERPILNIYQNQAGQQHKAWDLGKVKPDGKIEASHFHENYGFDLDKVLKNFSIKELATPEYKQRLIESLQRGNLQSVTFIDKNNKEEKLYISPDIRLGAMKVYDHKKTQIPTDKLAEKGYIGNELAKKIKERISIASQNSNQMQKGQPSDNTTQAQGLGEHKPSVKAKKEKHNLGDIDGEGGGKQQKKA